MRLAATCATAGSVDFEGNAVNLFGFACASGPTPFIAVRASDQTEVSFFFGIVGRIPPSARPTGYNARFTHDCWHRFVDPMAGQGLLEPKRS
jgi:hypothetical protein